MRQTLVSFATAKLKLAGVALAAAALSTSAVAITTVSAEDPLVDGVEEVLVDPETGTGGDEGTDEGSEEQQPTEEQPTEEQPAEEQPTEEEPAEQAPEEPVVEEPAPVAGELPPCPADVKNHGQYVSSVAKDKSGSGAEHGARVSAAAQSDCGKKPADAGEQPEQPEAEAQRSPEQKSADKQQKAEQKSAVKQQRAEQRSAGKPAKAPAAQGAGKGGGKK